MNKIIDINLNTRILTGTSCAKLCIKIMELILFQRNQIPFVFTTFKFLINKLEKSKKEANDESLPKNFSLERQRDLAVATMNGIRDLAEALNKAFCNQNTVSSIRLIFGSTPLNPKEVFVINIPELSKYHTHENHLNLFEADSNEISRILVHSEELFECFSTQLDITNMFLDISFVKISPETIHDLFSQKESFLFPPSCKFINLNIINEKNCETGTCCKELKIFNDLNQESVSIRTEEHKNNNVSNGCFWEANAIIKGFKGTVKSLWNCSSN